jgi:type 1 glutamine amidotransferase
MALMLLFARPYSRGLTTLLIGVAAVMSCGKPVASQPENSAPASFQPLFDGKSLEGWEGDSRFWRVEDGIIVGQTTVEHPAEVNTFLIWKGGEVADFELKAEFKILSGNSGIQYRSFKVDGQPYVLGGYQADISADGKWTGAAYGERYKQIMARRGQKTVVGDGPKDLKVVAQLGDPDEIRGKIDQNGWNEFHITAVGNQIVQRINGIITCEFSEQAEDRLKKGLIGLQLHAGPPMEVQFKNIRLRKLSPDDKKQILFLAGKKSHGYMMHEHSAGCHLLARCFHESEMDVTAQVITEGAWPEPWQGYDKPDTVVMYCDGFKRHMAKDHQDKIQALRDQGIGVACMHFGVEVDPEELGAEFLDWIGGYFEIGWSVNPHWEADFKELPDHPIANGVKPFKVFDEWYYHMRFQKNMAGVTPILSAVPPVETLLMRMKDKNRGSNPTVLKKVQDGEPQALGWAYERPDNGGRGFGFTGGHYHENWRHDDFRKVVLNALAWTAKAEIPEEGVQSRTPSEADLALNQDYPAQEKYLPVAERAKNMKIRINRFREASQ